MAEDTHQAIQTPETTTQDAPTPSADQKTTEVPVEGQQNGLPEDASDRTKSRFDELTSQLKEERQRREALEGAFSAMQPKQPAPEPIYDPNTGYVNENALTDIQRRTIEAEQRATKAEQAVQSYLTQQEEREAYVAHPWLNPNDKNAHDSKRYNLAVGIALSSMVKPENFGGKQLNLKEAGDFVASLTTAQVAEAKKEGAQQAIEQLTPKEQAALEATGTSAGRTNIANNLETLRHQTRRGSQDAIVSRLQGLKTQA
jgi:hypothetical protein